MKFANETINFCINISCTAKQSANQLAANKFGGLDCILYFNLSQIHMCARYLTIICFMTIADTYSAV